jgi:hypothetical protein
MTSSSIKVAALLLLVCGCGGSDPAKPDGSAPDASADAGADVTVADTGADASADAAFDSGSDAGACAMLVYSANNEPAITEPWSVTYPAFADASVAGQGSNGAHVGYTVSVTYVSGATGLSFGVFDSDVGEGVPWDDVAGSLDDGHLRAFSIDLGSASSTHMITITFDTPVTGFKFGVTDLDFTSEVVQVDAFATATGGTAIALTDNLLASPPTMTSLALGAPHTGNDAYVVDQTKVSALGNNRYQTLVSGAISDRTGTVLFAYDDATAVRRVQVTYSGANTGVWLAGMTYANLCGP